MEYIRNGKYFAQIAGSLEPYAVMELTTLGAEVLNEVPRGVRFSCDKRTLYRILYTSRLCQRILAPLFSFNCHSEDYLYQQAFRFDWTELFDPEDTFRIVSNVNRSKITNSQYAAQVLKDAIVDRFRERYDDRPDVSLNDADVVINLHIQDNRATLSLDIAGHSLHKRGYRVSSVTAPLQETLAAAIIHLSGWNGDNPLLDVVCGSGTILAEALMHYCRIPAGYLRDDHSIVYMPDYDRALWDEVREQADNAIRPLLQGLISGSDMDPKAVAAARANLQRLPYGDKVSLTVSRFQDLPRIPDRTIVSNPPYGIRIGEESRMVQLYNDLGDFLKQKCPASTAYILCGSVELVSALRLRAYWKKTLKNGDIDAKLAKIILR